MQDFINKELEDLDLTKVPAIQQKRTLAFVNHFVFTTVQYLNNFIRTCEQKLMEFERKINKTEAAMVLLEARLSSIPEVNSITVAEETKNEVNKEDKVPVPNIADNDVPIIETQLNYTVPTVSPEYERFLKMVQVGVPLEAVKLKVSLEGLDPNILEKALK